MARDGSVRPQSDAAELRWDLDALDADGRRDTYRQLDCFVAWLRACDVTVPQCWYTHGWVVWRLAALAAWQERAYAADAAPREAVDWWSSGLQALRQDWEDLLGHRGRHADPDSPVLRPRAVPSLDAFLAGGSSQPQEETP